jgi:hypothetical protein
VDALLRMTVSDVSRFLDKVDRAGPCWTWTAAKDKDGYGFFKIRHGGSSMVKAHRVAYFIATDEHPRGLFVCHRCDNPSCVRPGHLFLGTVTDNRRDCFAKGRARISHGARHTHAKLTESRVQDIRRRAASGESRESLAREYGVSPMTLGYAIRRQTWKHVP